MEVNSGGGGVWYKAKVSTVMVGESGNQMCEYQVKYSSKAIRYVSKVPVKGTGKTNSMPLCVYGLVGWTVSSRANGLLVVQRDPQPLAPRGFAVTRRTTKTRISALQVCN